MARRAQKKNAVKAIDGEITNEHPVDAEAYLTLFDGNAEDLTYKTYTGEVVAEEIPLFDMLNAVDRNDIGFYDRLSDEKKQKFSPWLVMQWTSSSTDFMDGAHLLWSVNELVNKDFSVISKHPKLFWMLLAMCGTGKRTKHVFPPVSKPKKNKIQEFMQELNPLNNLEEIDLLISMHTVDELKDLAQQYGYPDDEIVTIFGK